MRAFDRSAKQIQCRKRAMRIRRQKDVDRSVKTTARCVAMVCCAKVKWNAKKHAVRLNKRRIRVADCIELAAAVAQAVVNEANMIEKRCHLHLDFDNTNDKHTSKNAYQRWTHRQLLSTIREEMWSRLDTLHRQAEQQGKQ